MGIGTSRRSWRRATPTCRRPRRRGKSASRKLCWTRRRRRSAGGGRLDLTTVGPCLFDGAARRRRGQRPGRRNVYLALLRAGASPRDSILSPKVRCRGAAHPCPAEARHPRADLGYVGEFERTWDSERAHGPNPAAATAHRRFLKRLKGLPFADPWRVGPAPASHGAPRPRDRVSSNRTARIRQLLASDFLAQTP